MPSVTLPWVQDLSFKMQSVLFSALRGPDTGDLPCVKGAVHWLRPATQHDAEPNNGYMRHVLPEWHDVERELGRCSVHYFGHLLHAFQIVGYVHPDWQVREQAHAFYSRMANLLHLVVEPMGAMDARLADRP